MQWCQSKFIFGGAGGEQWKFFPSQRGQSFSPKDRSLRLEGYHIAYVAYPCVPGIVGGGTAGLDLGS